MKVLLISPLAPPAGGIATWTELYLKSELVKSGEMHVDLVNSNVGGNRVKAYSKKSILSEIKRSYRIFTDLKKYLSKEEYEIVHLNNSCSTLGMARDFLLAKYIKAKKQKLLIHFHCDIPAMVKGSLGNVLLKKLCKVSDKRLVLNSSSELFLQERGFTSKNVPNFFDINSIEYKKRVHKDKIERIIFVGHVVRTKGCNEIIEVAKHFKDIEFRLVGNIGEEFKNREYDSNVKLVGEVSKENVLEELRKADIMLFPSHTEGFPNVIMEAMAVELPIISSDVGAISDILKETNESLFKPKKVNEILELVRKFQNKKVREDNSKINYKILRRDYTADKVIRDLFCAYQIKNR